MDQGMTVQQAHNIDKKIDDGLPQYGNVRAWYVDWGKTWWYLAWATGTGGMGTHDSSTGDGISSQTASAYADDYSNPSKLCYVNGGATNVVEQYNTSYPTSVNCALSFKFQ